MTLLFKNYIHLTQEHSKAILALRNSEYIRTHMHNSEIIPLENHLQWLSTLHNNSTKEYFALIVDDVIVGSCSWLKDDKEVVSWGIFFVPTINPIISSLSAYLFIDYLFEKKGFQSLDSQVLKNNPLAFKFNQNLGFSLYQENNQFYSLSLHKKEWKSNANNRFITSLKKYLGKIKYEFQ